MARPIWKGAISFGLVTVPVGLYSAIDRKEELRFRQLHSKDHSPIELKRFCTAEDKEVPWAEVEKGYEYRKGQFVVVTDEDFKRARVPATQTYEIREFVTANELDYLYFEHPYYLAPSGRGAVKAYALLRDALQETGRVGIGTIVLRQREHLGALEPSGDALVLTTMRFAYEIRSPKDLDLDLPRAGTGWTKKEMDLAHKLIDALAGPWDPTEYRDTYTEVLKQVIEAKVEGKAIVVPQPERRPRVATLMKALEESLKTGRKAPAKLTGRAAAKAGGRKLRRAA